MASDYLESVQKRFKQYQSLGEKAMAQVEDEQLFWQYNAQSNSMALIVQHLWGNMLSRWTHFLMEDGEKQWRERDAEFELQLKTREELLARWNDGWNCLFTALESLEPADLTRTIFIRNEPIGVTDAINRQLAHYAYHVGQLVFIGKMVAGDHWVSLSIPPKRKS